MERSIFWVHKLSVWVLPGARCWKSGERSCARSSSRPQGSARRSTRVRRVQGSHHGASFCLCPGAHGPFHAASAASYGVSSTRALNTVFIHQGRRGQPCLKPPGLHGVGESKPFPLLPFLCIQQHILTNFVFLFSNIVCLSSVSSHSVLQIRWMISFFSFQHVQFN